MHRRPDRVECIHVGDGVSVSVLDQPQLQSLGQLEETAVFPRRERVAHRIHYAVLCSQPSDVSRQFQVESGEREVVRHFTKDSIFYEVVDRPVGSLIHSQLVLVVVPRVASVWALLVAQNEIQVLQQGVL